MYIGRSSVSVLFIKYNSFQFYQRSIQSSEALEDKTNFLVFPQAVYSDPTIS